MAVSGWTRRAKSRWPVTIDFKSHKMKTSNVENVLSKEKGKRPVKPVKKVTLSWTSKLKVFLFHPRNIFLFLSRLFIFSTLSRLTRDVNILGIYFMKLWQNVELSYWCTRFSYRQSFYDFPKFSDQVEQKRVKYL